MSKVAESSEILSVNTEVVGIKKPLKAIMLLGEGLPLTPETEALYREEGYLLIGDGKSYLTRENIKEQVAKAGGADSRTRWDIHVHGAVGDVEVIGDRVSSRRAHACLLFGGLHETSEVLSLIKDIAVDNPTEVHLWSCFAGAAASCYGDILPPGSPLICHGAENLYAVSEVADITFAEQISKRQKLPESDANILDYTPILADLPLGAVGKCFVSISGEEVSLRFNRKDAKRLLMTPEGIRDMSQEFVKTVYSWAKMGESHYPIKLPSKMPAVDLSDEDIQRFQQRNFHTQFLNNTEKFKNLFSELLVKEDGKEYIIKQLKSEFRGKKILTDSSTFQCGEVSSFFRDIIDWSSDKQKRSLLGLDDKKGTGFIGFLMRYPPFNERSKMLFEFAARSGKEALDKVCENDENGMNILSCAFFPSEGKPNFMLEEIYKSISCEHDPSIEAILDVDSIKKMLRNESGQPVIFTILESNLLASEIIESVSLLNSTSHYLGEPAHEHFILKDKDGQNILHCMAKKNDSGLVREFLNMVCDYRDEEGKELILNKICEPDKSGKTPILLAIENGNLEILSSLVEKLGVERVRKMMKTDKENIDQLIVKHPPTKDIILNVELKLRDQEANFVPPSISLEDIRKAGELLRTISPDYSPRSDASTPDSIAYLDLAKQYSPKVQTKTKLKRSSSTSAILS